MGVLLKPRFKLLPEPIWHADGVFSRRTPEHRARLQENAKRYRLANAERVKEHDKKSRERRKSAIIKWRNNNRNKIKEYAQRWRLKNREKCTQMAVSWQRRNPDLVRAYDKKRHNARRAMKRGLLHPDHDQTIENRLIKESIRLTKVTGVTHCVDHVIPLKHGGWHHHDNMQILDINTNSRKAANPVWRMDGRKTFAEVDPALWPDALRSRYLKILKEEQNCLS